MAQIVRRPRSDGGVTWQVKWRLGGTRDGAWQAESFTHEARALAFKADVEDAEHFWPDGWVKGEGYVTTCPPTGVVTFANVLDDYWRIQERKARRGRIKPHTLARDKRAAELHLSTFATMRFDSITVDDVDAWVGRSNGRDDEPTT